LLNKLKLKKA